jgi:hypothetical protein
MPFAHAAVKDAARRFAVPHVTTGAASLTAAPLRARRIYAEGQVRPSALEQFRNERGLLDCWLATHKFCGGGLFS